MSKRRESKDFSDDEDDRGGGKMAVAEEKPYINSRKNSLKKSELSFQPSSPTDSMLSPISKKLLHRKTSRAKIPEVDYETWNVPKHVKIILGTRSPARKQIFNSLNWQYEVASADIDEDAVTNCQDPYKYPVIIAKAKASALLRNYTDIKQETVLLTYDEVAVFHGVIRNRPHNEREAREYFRSYSNDYVKTVTAVVATHLPSCRQCHEIDVATIHWDQITEEQENILVSKDEVYQSSGGILVEDADFKQVIKSIEGDVDSIVGLPIKVTKKAIRSVINPVI